MSHHSVLCFSVAWLFLSPTAAQAQETQKDPAVNPRYVHPLIKDHGRVVVLPKVAEQPQPGSKVLLDITSDATEGKVVKGLDRAALMMNQFASVGLRPDQVQMAIVLHGPATKAALSHEAYAKRSEGKKNPNLELISRLRQAGVEVFVCGQALAHRNFGIQEVAPEVTVAFSAATVNINKQTNGYAYIPFM